MGRDHRRVPTVLARARAETLLRVEARVSGKVEACRAEVKAADERVSPRD